MLEKIKLNLKDPNFKKLSILFLIGSFFLIVSTFSGTFILARGHPSTPERLAVTGSDSSTVALSWELPRGSTKATDYIIQYRIVKAKTWSTFADGTSSKTTVKVTSLKAGTPYEFQVAATNRSGTSSYSASVNTTTLDVPGRPTNLSVTSTDLEEVSLSWTAPSSNGGATVNDYRIQFQKSGGSYSTFANGTSTNTIVTVTGLDVSSTYNFKVAARNSVGTGTYSSSVQTTTDDPTAADAPTGLTAGAIATSTIDISWTAPSNNGGADITDYVTQWQTFGAGSWNTFADGTSTNTSTTFTGLTATTTYSFRIAAVNSVGTGTYSNKKSISTISSVSASDSTFVISKTYAAADGSDIIKITAKALTDVLGGVNGVNATLKSSVAGILFTSTSTTDNTGEAVFNIKSSNVVDSTFSIILDGVNVTQTRDVGFKEPPRLTINNPVPVANGISFSWEANHSMSKKVIKIKLRGNTDYEIEDEIIDVDTDSFAITNLEPCTTYGFQIDSEDNFGLNFTDTEKTATTTGCLGSAPIENEYKQDVVMDNGGEFNFSDQKLNLDMIIPRNIHTKALTFSAKRLNRSFWNNISPPKGFKLMGHPMQLNAYENATSTVTEFLKPIEIKMTYSESEIPTGKKPSSLVIKRFDGSNWHTLDNCSVNTNTKEIKCETENFSVFGIFSEGDTGSSDSDVSSGGGGVATHLLYSIKIPEDGFKIYINEEQDFVTEREVTLSFNVADDITKMSISNKIDMGDASIQSYQEEIIWDLCSEADGLIKDEECFDGQHTIFVRFYNDYGNSSDIIMSSIILDSGAVGSKLEESILGGVIQYFDNLLKYFTHNNKNYYIVSEDILKEKGVITEDYEVEDINVLEEDEEIIEDIGIEEDKVIYKFNKYLYRGIKGDEVRNLQSLLKDLGYFVYNKLTGYYGLVTRKAVTEFQKDNDLPGVGVVGPLTRKLLEEIQK